MIKNYDEYLKDNLEIINFIRNNNLEKDIKIADDESKQLAALDGKQYLHSYRYSTIYDTLMDKNVKTMKVSTASIAITNLLENPYNKTLDSLIDDCFSIECGMEI